MNTSFCRSIQDKALRAIKDAFATDPTLSSINVFPDSGVIEENKVTFKFVFSLPTDKAVKVDPILGDLTTDAAIKSGLALTGTRVLFHGKFYTIVRARNVKYLASSEEDGKNYLLRFEGCSLAPAKVVA